MNIPQSLLRGAAQRIICSIWDRLLKSGRTILVEIGALIELLEDRSTNVVEVNAARRLSQPSSKVCIP